MIGYSYVLQDCVIFARFKIVTRVGLLQLMLPIALTLECRGKYRGNIKFMATDVQIEAQICVSSPGSPKRAVMRSFAFA